MTEASEPRTLFADKILLAIVGFALVIHVLCILIFPVQVRWGDEENYAAYAHRFLEWPEKILHLVPGAMPHYWQPPFPYSLYALFTEREFAEEFHREPMPESVKRWSPGFARLYGRIALLNLALLLTTGGCIYEICRRLRMGRTCGLLAAAWVVFHPRLAFFIQSLWPELLHLALFSGALLSLIALMQSHQKPTIPRLVSTGALFGLCALTKGIVLPFLLLAAPLLFMELRRIASEGRISTRHMLILYAVCAVVVVPQMLTSRATRGTLSVATNTWINVELGIIPEEEAGVNLYRRYFGSSGDPVERERLSKRRTVEFLSERNPVALLAHQVRQLIEQQLNESYFARGLRDSRWRGLEPGPQTVRTTGWLIAAASWATLLLGLAGLWRGCERTPGARLLVLYVIYYLATLLVIGFNPRFFVQVLPFLAIFASSFLVRLANAPRPVDR